VLLDPQERQRLDGALRSSSTGDDPLSWLTRFDPSETALVGPVIKVRGTTTVRAAAAEELIVHVDYTVVYAVQRAAGGEVTRVVVRHIFDLASHHRRGATASTLSITDGRAGAAGVECEPHDGYLHPSYLRTPVDASPSAPVRDPYDQRQPPGGSATCGFATRI